MRSQHAGKADIETRKNACEARWLAVQELAKKRRTTLEASQELQQFLRDAESESKYLAYRLKALEATDFAKARAKQEAPKGCLKPACV